MLFYSGLSTLVSRVHVGLWPGVVGRLQTDIRRVYLTFDDGPSNSLTDILGLLERENARATFFFSDAGADTRPLLIKDVLSAGHGIGVHGYDHLSAWRSRSSAIVRDQARSIKVLEAATGERILWARPPYGRLTPALWNWYRRSGLRVALWDVDPADYRSATTPENVCRFIRSSARPGSIVLLHEKGQAWEHGFDALAKLLSEMRADGWRFDALPEMRADGRRFDALPIST